MPSPVKFRIDRREFDQALRKYRQYSKRDVETIVNTKAFFIARRATVETPKANKKEVLKIFTGGNSGRIVGMIINKRRGARGERGLYGAAMNDAVLLMKAARLRSIAFLKSGWLPAIKTLAPLAEKRGAPRSDRAPKQYGQAKGRATPARPGWFPKAIIENLASAKHETKEALIKFGGPALQRAFDFETNSMLEYIERKLKKSARDAGIKTS